MRLELALALRNGESLLLTLGIPVAVLVFFSLVDVLPIDGDAVDFLAPGALALAVLATAFANLAIATGFDRSYGVLKRLGATPLGRPRLVAAKGVAVLVVIAVQVVVLVGAALALGWEPDVEPVPLVAAPVLAVAAFAGLALVLAGRSRALVAWPRPTPSSWCCCCCRAWCSRSTSCRPACGGGRGAAVDRAGRGGARARWPAGPTSPAGCGPCSASGRSPRVALAIALFRWEPNDSDAARLRPGGADRAGRLAG